MSTAPKCATTRTSVEEIVHSRVMVKRGASDRGAICLAQRSNRVARIAADVVRKGDFFEYSKGLFPKLEHKPCDGERGDITHAYALANFTNGGYCFEVWTVGQITEHAQKFSKSYYKYDYKTRKQIINPNSPWQTHFESMAKKTMIPVTNSRIITKFAAGRPQRATSVAPMTPPMTPPAQNRVWPQANSVCTTCTKLESPTVKLENTTGTLLHTSASSSVLARNLPTR